MDTKKAMRRCVAVLAVLVGCAGEANLDDHAEEDVLLDAKLDSFGSPTHHGERLAFGPTENAELTDDARYHVWSFELSGVADVTAKTSATSDGGETDTVLYLYKQREDGTFYRPFARNDDSDGVSSSLAVTLQRGAYRALVKGKTRQTRGAFAFGLGCSGPGCVPAYPSSGADCDSSFNAAAQQAAAILVQDGSLELHEVDDPLALPGPALVYLHRVEREQVTQPTTVFATSFSGADTDLFGVYVVHASTNAGSLTIFDDEGNLAGLGDVDAARTVTWHEDPCWLEGAAARAQHVIRQPGATTPGVVQLEATDAPAEVRARQAELASRYHSEVALYRITTQHSADQPAYVAVVALGFYHVALMMNRDGVARLAYFGSPNYDEGDDGVYWTPRIEAAFALAASFGR